MNSRKLNILYVVDYFPPHKGGIETMFDKLTREMAKKHNVTVATIRMPGTKHEEYNAGRKILRFDVSRLTFWTLSWKIPKLVRDADIVHTSSFTGSFALLNIFEKRGKTVVTVHELWGSMWSEFHGFVLGHLFEFMEKIFCRMYKNSETTCPSEYTRHAMLKSGFSNNNITVIPHGIDHKIFNEKVKPLRKFGFPTYLFLGRPGKSKGIEYLMEATRLIENGMPEAQLVLMVSKDDLDKFKPFLRMLRGFEDRIVWIEPKEKQKDVARLIRSVDCVVVPSISEGFGFVAAEAQACGVPVVASNAGSLPEVVKGGLLVEPRSPQAIADAVLKILSNEKLSKKLSRMGIKWTNRYQWSKAVDQYEKVYWSLRR